MGGTEGLAPVALGALVLMGFALAMSRRSLGIGVALCLLALAILGYGFVLWLRVG